MVADPKSVEEYKNTLSKVFKQQLFIESNHDRKELERNNKAF